MYLTLKTIHYNIIIIKNENKMKRTLKTFVAFAIAMACTLCLVACGKTVKLTEKNLVGTYDVSQSVYTDYGKEAKTYTKEYYNSLKDKTDKTETETADWNIINSIFNRSYNVKDDKAIVEVKGETETKVGSWEIKDGKLNVTKDEDYMKSNEQYGTITITAEWDKATGNIIIKVVFEGKENYEDFGFTNVMTLVKQA